MHEFFSFNFPLREYFFGTPNPNKFSNGLSLNRPYNIKLINLFRSVLTGKSYITMTFHASHLPHVLRSKKDKLPFLLFFGHL